MNDANATVFLVDDDSAVRDALTLMFEQEGFAIKAFDSADAFLAAYQPENFGCAIIDIRMPGMDGLQLQEALNKLNIMLPIIFLTGHGDIPKSVKAIKAGAVDFLTKPVTREKLMASVQAAIQESAKKLSENSHHQDALSHLNSLTSRERDVMMLAIQGQPNKEIARRLGISHRTVEIHKSKIMHKTGAVNLLDLVRIAHESGITF
ncbi:response regulator transcription factor [Methylotenera sp.]|uniref:response regulator transcription factor n=1 Tax=Methylotenera sp. TaxID=2051956 RepID=UPI00272FD3D2|nr:response regulator [Methylotenera sp.]MDP2071975.1 response regulator [Methylotenera sp.]MDP2231624.1 response regulator [Methylotenera sp.]MDP3007016.1 response regulator [Methylotenera sp.]MDP3007047.1 response regulator [Methylotenera sp.]MDP3140848.1 response regulator [Methylotenera sp.]